MRRKYVLTALASAAMCGSAARAHPGGGPGGGMGGPPAGVGGGMGNIGGIGNAGGMNDFGVTARDQARANSQGPNNASATGVANANENSVLAGTTATARVTSGALAGLTTGMTLFSNGTAVGTVQQIRTSANGNVVVVLVKGTNGGVYAVPANKLTLASGTLSTTARFNGINGGTSVGVASRTQARANSQGPVHASATGIAHANQNSVLAGASSATPLTGVTAGMSVMQNGAQVGTVQRVLTNGQGTIVRVLVQGSNGRIYSLSPTQLSLSGSTLTATGIRI
jgi:hypothetical protein